ncbi:hypothetical protein A2U01_0034814 [Trifolium medium]|uniref:Uncharacterized protein n=1 Tax=Trifolium medium TaxID=97028 RepID=A0A392PPE3_9FABA|nr:hypothetical protein [Trifolium medium]
MKIIKSIFKYQIYGEIKGETKFITKQQTNTVEIQKSKEIENRTYRWWWERVERDIGESSGGAGVLQWRGRGWRVVFSGEGDWESILTREESRGK